MRRLALLLVLEATAVTSLVSVAPVFVNGGRIDDPIATALWAVALVLGAWLLLSTVCSAAVAFVPLAPRWLDAVVRRTTLPAVRVAVAGAFALGSTTLTAPNPVAADTTSSTIRTGRDITVVEPERPASTLPTTAPPAARVPATTPPTSPALPDEHRVVPGDNLWTIASSRLATHLGRRPSESEVARYWAVVVDVNRPRVRSGDPDLIFPGELIALPPV